MINAENQLLSAAQSGDLQALDDAISKKPYLDVRDTRDGLTALMLAARRGHVDVIRRLVDAGADINARTQQGSTALKHALDFDRLDSVLCLIELGADVNTRLTAGWTPLMFALRSGNNRDAIMDAPINAGADMEATNDLGYDVFYLAEQDERTKTHIHGLVDRLHAAHKRQQLRAQRATNNHSADGGLGL